MPLRLRPVHSPPLGNRLTIRRRMDYVLHRTATSPPHTHKLMFGLNKLSRMQKVGGVLTFTAISAGLVTSWVNPSAFATQPTNFAWTKEQQNANLTPERRKQIEQDNANAKDRAAANALAEASKALIEAKLEEKMIADGWYHWDNGIYSRWCTQTCDKSKVIGNARYSLMEVWAKDQGASIYAEVNLLNKDNVVVGYTNDTLRLQKGQKGVMAFDSYQKFHQMEVTKFNIR